jgi:hypothetical protein
MFPQTHLSFVESFIQTFTSITPETYAGILTSFILCKITYYIVDLVFKNALWYKKSPFVEQVEWQTR